MKTKKQILMQILDALQFCKTPEIRSLLIKRFSRIINEMKGK